MNRPRARGGPVSEEVEKAILAALEAGRSVRAVGAEVGRSKSTVSNVAKRNGMVLVDVHHAKKAAEARARYAAEARLALLVNALEKAETLLDQCTTGKEFQAIMVGAGITLDKLKIESERGDDGAAELRKFFLALREGGGKEAK